MSGSRCRIYYLVKYYGGSYDDYYNAVAVSVNSVQLPNIHNKVH